MDEFSPSIHLFCYLVISNPYSHSRPGIAKVSPADKAPDSGNFDPNSMPELTPDLAPIKDGLLEIVAALMSAAVTGAEKRMLIEGEKGVTVLLKKLSRNQVSSEIAGQVANMVKALQAKDYASATAVQAALVNHDWHDHKDWLKGIKFINQLAAKKLAT
jgi:protein transport protein SEC31